MAQGLFELQTVTANIAVDVSETFCAVQAAGGQRLLDLFGYHAGSPFRKEDISFFRKIFIRLTGLRPKEYRQRFAGYTAGPSQR